MKKNIPSYKPIGLDWLPCFIGCIRYDKRVRNYQKNDVKLARTEDIVDNADLLLTYCFYQSATAVLAATVLAAPFVIVELNKFAASLEKLIGQ